jgi:NADH-ubiquinone oxidoreductase chain 1
MTEHAAVIFVFFFLAEYASIVVICILTSILFLGGYLIPVINLSNTVFIYGISSSLILGIKASLMIFVFI